MYIALNLIAATFDFKMMICLLRSHLKSLLVMSMKRFYLNLTNIPMIFQFLRLINGCISLGYMLHLFLNVSITMVTNVRTLF